MSLILDALTRSEKERQERAGAISLDPYAVAPRKHVAGKVVLWVVLALIANAIILYVLFNRQVVQSGSTQPVTKPATQPQHPVPVVTASKSGRLIEPVVVAQPVRKTVVTRPAPVIAPTEPARSLREELGVPRQSVDRRRPVETEVEETLASLPSPRMNPEKNPDPVSLPAENEVSLSAGTSSVRTQNIPSLNDAPDDIQTRLSRYEINAHIYSSTSSRRWALINMKRYHEGDTLAGSSFRVDKITPQGVVIDYGSGQALLSVSP